VQCLPHDVLATERRQLTNVFFAEPGGQKLRFPVLPSHPLRALELELRPSREICLTVARSGVRWVL
jgi:hypothetical protein